MKILLLTDMPPCKNFTAGLVLAQLVKFLPKDSVACYCPLHPHLAPELDPELAWMPLRVVPRPRESSLRLLPGRLGFISSFALEMYHEWFSIPKLVKDAVAFAKEFKPDLIWCVLEGQTMFRMAVKLSEALQLPLHTEVWDPPGWWLRANSVDFLSRKLLMGYFDKAMRLSKSCAAASWAMAEDYNQKYYCNALHVIPSLDAKLAKKPAKEMHDRDYCIIGMAGQLYSQVEWNHLLLALEHVNWTVNGKKIIIRLFGRNIYAPANSAQHIEFLGWRSQSEVIQLLSEADILYCPYWFDHTYEQEARFSFPSKLTTYLAAGRPVFFHGPSYASPSRFLEKYDAAVFCHDLSKSSIYNCIDRLIWDKELYSKLTENGHKAFMENLTTDAMRRQFMKFLNLENHVSSDLISSEKEEMKKLA